METLTTQIPDDVLSQDLNGRREADPGFKAPNVTGYGVMRVTNLMTREFLGYLGNAYNSYVDIEPNLDNAAQLKWRSNGAEIYLEKQTDPDDRYLGVGYNDYACYGLWTPTGWVDAVIHNADGTISLKSDPSRKMYKYGNNYVCWSNGESNQNILSFEMEW